MKKLMMAALLLAFIGCSQKREYSVYFIETGETDTSFLINVRPLTYSYAKEVADEFIKQREGRKAAPIKMYWYDPCKRGFWHDSIGFMLHGGILDKYDEGRVYVSIVKIVNPQDWSFNEYFTGTGFSKNESEEKKVLEADSCELKKMYFEYSDNLKQNQ